MQRSDAMGMISAIVAASPVQRLRGGTDATAEVHCGAWRGRDVADRGQGTGARTDTARQRAYEPRGEKYGTSILVGSLHPGTAPARVDRRPKSAFRHLLERERYPART